MSRKLDNIVHLRGLAALAVLGFHSLVARDAASLNPTLSFARRILVHGWLGVYVFFAISGWCIAQRIAAAYEGAETPLAYSWDRACRIYPTYWAAVAFSLLLMAAATPFNGIPLSRNVPHHFSDWLASLALVQPAFGYNSLLLVSWTLFNELSFYAAGAMALVLRRLGVGARWLLLIGGFACPLISWHPPAGLLIGFSLWPTFFIGMLAWWFACRRANFIWIVSLSLTVVSLAREQSYVGEVAFATAVVLTVAALHPLRLPSLAQRSLMALGAASYSIYLVHVSVISPFNNLTGRFVSPLSNISTVVWIVGLALAVGAGMLLHKIVEVPCERWRYKALSARISTDVKPEAVIKS